MGNFCSKRNSQAKESNDQDIELSKSQINTKWTSKLYKVTILQDTQIPLLRKRGLVNRRKMTHLTNGHGIISKCFHESRVPIRLPNLRKMSFHAQELSKLKMLYRFIRFNNNINHLNLQISQFCLDHTYHDDLAYILHSMSTQYHLLSIILNIVLPSSPNEVTVVPVKFKQLVQLKSFEFNYVSLQPLGAKRTNYLAQFVSGLQNLTNLSCSMPVVLNRNYPREAFIHLSKSIGKLQHLKKLRVRHENSIMSQECEYYFGLSLAKLKKLTEFDCLIRAQSGITCLFIRNLLSPFSELTEIENIKLILLSQEEKKQQANIGLEKCFSSLTKLRSLEVITNYFTDDDALNSIHSIPERKNLKQFGTNISSSLTRKGICYLTEFLNHSTDLTKLDLNFEKGAIETKKLVTSLSKSVSRLRQLTELSLRINGQALDDVALIAYMENISKIKGLRALKTYIQGPDLAITKNGFQSFKNCLNTLKELNTFVFHFQNLEGMGLGLVKNVFSDWNNLGNVQHLDFLFREIQSGFHEIMTILNKSLRKCKSLNTINLYIGQNNPLTSKIFRECCETLSTLSKLRSISFRVNVMVRLKQIGSSPNDEEQDLFSIMAQLIAKIQQLDHFSIYNNSQLLYKDESIREFCKALITKPYLKSLDMSLMLTEFTQFQQKLLSQAVQNLPFIEKTRIRSQYTIITYTGY